MPNEIEKPAMLSRRSVLQKLAITAGGTALIAGTVATVTSAVADEQVKMAQKVVGYQETPKNGQACATCVQFEPPSSCKVVAGTISPAGWCQLYVKKT
jgi:hypothetical protein